MTSANRIDYDIEKNNEWVGTFSINIMCKSDFSKLLKYQPLNEHTVKANGYDEEEEYWEDEPKNLEEFLKRLYKTDKTIKEYFDTIK